MPAKVRGRDIQKVLSGFPRRQSSLVIPMLQAIQEKFGYVPPLSLREIAGYAGVKAARVYGVVTFYAQFYLEPRGRHLVRACRGTACHVRGGKKVADAIKRTLGLEEGQTSPDYQFTFETVACVGACALGPTVIVDGTYYGKMTAEKSRSLLQGYVKGK